MHSERVVKLFSRATDDRSDQKASGLVHCASLSEKLIFMHCLLLRIIGISTEKGLRSSLFPRIDAKNIDREVQPKGSSFSGKMELQSLSCALNFQVRVVS